MLSTAIHAYSLFCDRITQLHPMLALHSSSSSQSDLGQSSFGYDPYHQEPTPEERLKAMAKSQEKQSQPSTERGKSRIRK